VKGVAASALSASSFVFDLEPVSANTGAMTIGDGAILPLGGTIGNTGTIVLASTGDETDLEILVRGATLQGGGQVVLSDNSQNVVSGGDASAVLTNVDNTISGAGQLGDGQMTLVNHGVIDANGSNALVIDTGSNTVVNTGTLEASGSGGMVVSSAVSGGGNAVISGPATLEFAAASDANVSFAAGAVGTLKLDQSGSFTGTVSGFAAGEGLDLTDVSFGAGATLGYAANASGTGGMLTVSDGVHTTSLALLGQYAAAGFQAAADQGGGTIITYTPTQASITDPTLLSNPQHTA
jgi:large repetitive protein